MSKVKENKIQVIHVSRHDGRTVKHGKPIDLKKGQKLIESLNWYSRKGKGYYAAQ